MWDFADQERLFPFKTIGDVLEENQRLKEEVRWLNDVITTNISEIYVQLETMFNQHSEDIESVRTDFADGITLVRSEHSGDIVSVRTEHSEDIKSVRTDFKENITSLRTDVVSLKLVDNINSKKLVTTS